MRSFVCLAATAALTLAQPAASQSEPQPAPKPAAKPAPQTAAKPAKKAEAKPEAAKKPAAKRSGAAKPDTSKLPGNPTLVGTFTDWGAYTADSRGGKLCYALSEPKSRSAANLKDTKAYLFISFRPSDNVRNELAAVLNFKTKEDGAAKLAVGATTYDLVMRGENAWVANAAEEAAAIAAMSKGGTASVQTVSARGTKVTDRYSLSGFAQALDRAKRDCP